MTNAFVLLHSLINEIKSGSKIIALLPTILPLDSKTSIPGNAQFKASIETTKIARLRWLKVQQRLEIMGVTTLYSVPTDTPRPNLSSTTEHNGVLWRERFCRIFPWGLTQFERVLLLEPDTLLLQEASDVFSLPPVAAARDPNSPDQFQPSVVLIQPKETAFKEITQNLVSSSPVQSPTEDWLANIPVSLLPFRFNADISRCATSAWNDYFAGGTKPSIVRFSGHSKPWNMAVNRPSPYPQAAECRPNYFDTWTENYNQHIRYMRSHASSTSADSTEFTEHCEMPSANSSKRTDKLSVILSTFDRFSMLRYLVKRYASFPTVHRVYVVWGNRQVDWRPFSKSLNVSSPVQFLYYGTDSLNDRFRPIPSLETEAVLICDDDIELSEASLQFALSLWQEHPHRLVGFSARHHLAPIGSHTVKKGRPAVSALRYHLPRDGSFSMALTKAFVAPRSLLRSYWCHVSSTAVREYVDSKTNCEDIAANFLMSSLSLEGPLIVSDFNKVDYGAGTRPGSKSSRKASVKRPKKKGKVKRRVGRGLSALGGLWMRKKHKGERTQCLKDLALLFGSFPLVTGDHAVMPFGSDLQATWRQQRAARATALHQTARPLSHGSLLPAHSGSLSAVQRFPRDTLTGGTLCLTRTDAGRWLHSVEDRFLLSVSQNYTHIPGTTAVILLPAGLPSPVLLAAAISALLNTTDGRERAGSCFPVASLALLLSRDGLQVSPRDSWEYNLLAMALNSPALLTSSREYLDEVAEGQKTCLEVAQVVTFPEKGSADSEKCRAAVETAGSRVLSSCSSEDSHASAEESFGVFLGGNSSFWTTQTGYGMQQSLEAHVTALCKERGIKCFVMAANNGDFCQAALLVSQSHVAIWPGSSTAVQSALFLRPRTHLITVSAIDESDSRSMQELIQCLQLQHQTWKHSEGVRKLSLMVAAALENAWSNRGRDGPHWKTVERRRRRRQRACNQTLWE